MAVIRCGPLVQAIRGALGSVVFARQGGTAIVRQRPLKCNQGSVRELVTRGNYVRVVAYWRAFTDGQRLAWMRAAETYRYSGPDGVTKPVSGWVMYATVALRLVDGGNVTAAEIAEPDPWLGEVEKLGVRLDVWPGGPVNLVHSRGTLTVEPPDVIAVYYRVSVQRTFRVVPTLPGRLMLRAWHNSSRTYSNNLLRATAEPGGATGTTFAAVCGSPGIGERVKWECVSHLWWWPAATIWAGLSEVPNVGAELMSNGDMEIPGWPGYTAPTGWSLQGAGTLTSETFDVWGDTASLRWVRAQGAGGTQVQAARGMLCEGGVTYNLRLAGRCVSRGDTIGVVLRDGVHTNQGIGTYAPGVDSIWAEWILPFTVSMPFGLCNVLFYYQHATALELYLDNVSVRGDL
jgi:hypothetical protein